MTVCISKDCGDINHLIHSKFATIKYVLREIKRKVSGKHSESDSLQEHTKYYHCLN